MMKVLFLGDVVSSPGRKVIQTFVPELRRSEKIDFVIANGENAAGGLGIDEKSAKELFEGGVDLITGGNHSWDKRDVIEYMARERRILRPANYPDVPSAPVPGKGHFVLEGPAGSGLRLGVINVMGRVHMDIMDCPFVSASKWVDWMGEHGVQSILVDIHAEATSEKQALAHFLTGRVSAVVGSHTHVQTADERLFSTPNGFRTAYITDAGMNGPYDSVIGMKKERSIQRFLSRMPQKFESAEGRPGLHGVIIEIDPKLGSAQSIRRIQKFLD